MSTLGDILKQIFGGRPAPTQPSQLGRGTSSDTSGVTDKMLTDLALAEAIYMDIPPWLNEENPPMLPSGIGPLIASIIATITTIEAKITVGNNEDINDIIQRFIMPNLREEMEKGWALGGLIFKPYYNNATFSFDDENKLAGVQGKLKIGFLYPSQYLIDDFDNSGAILKIRMFNTIVQNSKFYTKVETQDYNENTRTLIITNEVFETSSTPTKYKWTDLGLAKVPLSAIDKWKNILPKMTFNDVHGCLVGLYNPPIANNTDFQSPYGLSPLVRAANALRRVDRVENGLDWEVDSSLARLFVDERAIPDMTNIPKKLAKTIVKILGDGGGDKKFFEKYSPDIRQEAYIKTLNKHLRRVEDIIGVAHGTVSDVDEVAKTATEIHKMKHTTYATVTDNQKALATGIKQLVAACQIWLFPTQVQEELEIIFDFDDSIANTPEEQLALYMMLQNAGNIPKWMTNSMYFNVDEDDAQEMVDEANAELAAEGEAPIEETEVSVEEEPPEEPYTEGDDEITAMLEELANLEV